MTKNTYTIVIDYGTLSGRAVLVNTKNGEIVTSSVFEYPHAVMDTSLPDGTPLGVDWALQHPADYIEVLKVTVPAVLEQSRILPEEVIGIGIDFTACTMLPVYADGTPLCFDEKFKSEPNAWVKLWKHHAAQDKADALNRIAAERGEKWLSRYGGKISSEWMIPKIWQTYDEAPEVYENAAHFMEAADWVIQQLTGNIACNACTAGYKAIWHKRDGFPSQEFFASLNSGLAGVTSKLAEQVYPAGSKAGVLTEPAAGFMGLKAGTAVAVANVDAHVSVPAVGITEPGKMLAIIGTSTCHMLLGTEEKTVSGMCGVVEDGILEGFYGYEAGQSCVGDHFQWFVENCVPAEYQLEADTRQINIHELLTEKTNKLLPGESGLLALDWWNGNRSVLVDVDLTGMLIGASLQTKPEEIYRALVEATAFGTLMIIDTFKENGVPVNEFYAAGGIAEKNAFMMQIYADVIGLPVRISASSQTPALGSAIFAALAAGKLTGGYDSLSEAVKAMVKLHSVIFQPRKSAVEVYQKLYKEYRVLHDYFGRNKNPVMKTLKSIRKEQKS